MKIILSPAKSIECRTVENTTIRSQALFLKEAENLAGKLKKMSVKKLAALMHLSLDLAQLNYDRFQNWEIPLIENETIVPAIAAFNGEVYKGLDVQSLSQDEIERAQNEIRILSGLYGILKPLDLIYPYRLEMGTKWPITPKTKNLYSFWGTKIANQLRNELDKEDFIINLASTEYFKAIDLKVLNRRVVTPHFKDLKNGEFKIIMMYAKHQRGAMARYIIQNNLKDPELLKLYQQDGYQFDSNQSTENDWVFVR